MIDEKESPHYQSGYYWGSKLVLHIENSIYGNVPEALRVKEEFLSDLKTNLDWKDDHPTILETKGYIQALKDSLNG